MNVLVNLLYKKQAIHNWFGTDDDDRQPLN